MVWLPTHQLFYTNNYFTTGLGDKCEAKPSFQPKRQMTKSTFIYFCHRFFCGMIEKTEKSFSSSSAVVFVVGVVAAVFVVVGVVSVGVFILVAVVAAVFDVGVVVTAVITDLNVITAGVDVVVN